MAHNALGKLFRKGISFVELTRRFPDYATSEAWFIKVGWPEGVLCPKCGSYSIQESATSKPQHYHSWRDGRKDFRVKTYTLKHSSPLGFQFWSIAIFLCLTNLKSDLSMKLHRNLGVTQKADWYLAHRILDIWANMFTGPAEADESYFGGKRMRNKLIGRGTVGKVAVASVKDRFIKRVPVRSVSQTEASALQIFVRCLEYDLESVNHSDKEFVQ